MSFLAKLFLDEYEIPVLNADILFSQSTDMMQKPNGKPTGGLIYVKVPCAFESMFMVWMFSASAMKNGHIRFYNRDGISRFADLEFWDCFCVNYHEHFASHSEESSYIQLTLSPGVLRFRNDVFEKHWKITDLNKQTSSAANYNNTAKGKSNEEKKVVRYYITDNNQNELKEYKTGDKIMLNIETQNLIGEMLNVFIEDKTHDFKYNGNIIENDIIRGYTISNDIERLELVVIDQKD